MKLLLSLAAALLSLGLTQPARSITPADVVIVQCRVTGPSILTTAGAESLGIPKVGINKDCAEELERYFNNGFTIRSIVGGPNITYTLTVPFP